MALDLKDLAGNISEFDSWNHAEKIKFFAWFLHSYKGLLRINSSNIKNCYQELHLEEPTNISPFLSEFTKRKPKIALKDKQGYYLVGNVRSHYHSKFGQRPATIQIDALLKELPDKVPNLTERTFLNETLICYRCGAFRAAIVMVWNLAYDHLCHYVLRNHIADFNTQYPKSYAKKHADAKMKAVNGRDDFGELKENEVIQICRSANIISNDVYKILNEKLGKRNTYAHSSSVTAAPQTAEEIIIDLVNNVVLKLV